MGIEYGAVNLYSKYGRPSLDLQFSGLKASLTDRVGNVGVEFTRDTTGTYIGSDGLIKTAAVDAPRFDHDPVTGESLGLLIEESRVNQFTYSDFGNNIWGAVNISKISTNNAAPDGSNTAVLIGNATDGSTNSFLVYSLNVTGTEQTFTFYAKATTTGQSAFIDYYDVGTSRARAIINLDDGSVTYVQQIGDGVITSTNVGNGWWRCQLTLTPNGTGVYEWRAGNYDSGDIYIWGAQLEAGSFPTSYIPTSGSTVTRAADVASITGTNFSSWYNTDASTVFWEGNVIAGPFGQYLLWSIQTDGNDRINGLQMTRRSNQGSRFTHYDSTSTADFDLNGPLWTDNSYRKLAGAIGQSSAAFADSGSLIGTDISYQVPSASDGLDTLFISNGSGGGVSRYNVHIKRLTYWPTRLSDSDLQRLTE
jgi:hypothetical protein